ncbi:MAG: 30S ribosomal protein S2 [archaeon]
MTTPKKEKSEEKETKAAKAVKEEKAEKPAKKEEISMEDKKAKLEALMKKAKKLEGAVEDVKDVNLKSKVKNEQEEKKDTLVPMEDYLKSSIHLGTRVITPDMRKYVYRRRADGLAVFNTALLDDKLRESADFMAKFAPENILLICKRESGWKAAKLFAQILGVKSYTKKYPAGVLTNTNLEDFFETGLVLICDPWLDKNALQDANRVGTPVMSICDTNNFTQGITQIVPGNNKAAKSIGIILYLLAKQYIEQRKLKIELPAISEFIEGWNEAQVPK